MLIRGQVLEPIYRATFVIVPRATTRPLSIASA
jgi:hypothetical protein